MVGDSGPAAPAFLHDGERRHNLSVPGFEHTVARDINDRSQAVDYGRRAGGEFEQRQAVLWHGRRGYDLSSRVVNGRGWVLREALSINERGQILCEAKRRGRRRFCLLTPAR